MASTTFIYNKRSPGLKAPFNNFNPDNVVIPRAPTVNDNANPTTIWLEPVNTAGTPTDAVYMMSRTSAGQNIWLKFALQGASGSFSSLTVTPGPISLTGTTSINTAGAAVTTIGTGGTGAVNIGNATGNTAVTGSLSATLSITSTTAGVVGVQLFATGDLGNGVVGENSVTNVVNTTQGAGALSILSTNGNAGNNTGFIKAYVGVTPVYIPYFANIAP